MNMANRFIYPRSEMMTYGLATDRKPTAMAADPENL
jgi:hypothetical protein